MQIKRKRLFLIVLGLSVSIVAMVYFLLRLRGHWGNVLGAFRRANYLCLVPGVGFIGILYWFRIRRWGLFLRDLGSVSKTAVASATCIGFMTNCVLPARLGELVRPYVLYQKTDVRFGHAVATSFGLERVFDLMGLSLLMFITWMVLPASLSQGEPAGPRPTPPVAGETRVDVSATAAGAEAENGAPATESPETIVRRIRSKGVYVAVAAAVAGVVLFCVALFPGFFETVGERFTRLLPEGWQEPARRTYRSATETLKFVKSPPGVGLALVYSLGLWLAQGVSTYALAWGLGLNIGIGGGFLVVIAVALAVALPQGPAFIGPFHVAAMVTVSCFAVGQEGAAGAFAILMWLVNVVPITLVGVGFLWYEGLSLGKVTAASSQLERQEL